MSIAFNDTETMLYYASLFSSDASKGSVGSVRVPLCTEVCYLARVQVPFRPFQQISLLSYH